MYRTWSRVVSASIYFSKYTLRHSNGVLKFLTADNHIAASIHFKGTILGNSGLGEQLLASVIHHLSQSTNAAFLLLASWWLERTNDALDASGPIPCYSFNNNALHGCCPGILPGTTCHVKMAMTMPGPFPSHIHNGRILWLQSQPKLGDCDNCCHLWW